MLRAFGKLNPSPHKLYEALVIIVLDQITAAVVRVLLRADATRRSCRDPEGLRPMPERMDAERRLLSRDATAAPLNGSCTYQGALRELLRSSEGISNAV